MYALFVAGDGTQEVSRREVEWIADSAQRYDTAGRAIVLANSRSSVQRLPLGNRDQQIERALAGLAHRMDKDKDLLFVYLTSHGSRDHQLQTICAALLPQLPAKRSASC